MYRPGPRSILVCVLALQGCAAIVRDAEKDYVEARADLSHAKVTITLKNSFIETYKNRATISVPFTVDRADPAPKPAIFDGDLHIAGRAPQIGLPAVAEIENSASEKRAVDLAHALEKSGSTVQFSGAWRIWPEHAGRDAEIQGEELPNFELTDPDHVFEIHPVTRIGDVSTLDSFKPVPGYLPGSADAVIGSYEQTKVTVVAGRDTTSIITGEGFFNDLEFIMRVDAAAHIVPDGRFIDADVLDLGGVRLAQQVRMVFVKDSPPEKAARHLRPGDRLHVFGIPRIRLSGLADSSRSAQAAGTIDRKLPYEIIVVGVY